MAIVDYADSASEDVDGAVATAVATPAGTPPNDDLRIILPAEPQRERAHSRRWAERYVRRLVALDAAVGLLAGGVAFAVRFGKLRDFTWPYLALTAALPLVWLAALALGRAYEQRFLFDGNDEYRASAAIPGGCDRRLALRLRALERRQKLDR